MRRQTHHPTQAYIYGETMGRQDLGKANAPSNTGAHVPQWETMADNARQGETREDKDVTGRRTHHTIQHRHTHVGRQWEKMGDKGDKTSGRRTQDPTQARMCGDNGTEWGTRGDKGDLGKADTPSNTCTHWGDHGRQWEARRDKASGIQHRHTCGGDNGRQCETPSKHRHACGETMGESGSRHHSTQAQMWGDHGEPWHRSIALCFPRPDSCP